MPPSDLMHPAIENIQSTYPPEPITPQLTPLDKKNFVHESPKCPKCGLNVYRAEEVILNMRSWHQSCFRCFKCDKTLTITTVSVDDHGNPHCSVCYKRIYIHNISDKFLNSSPDVKFRPTAGAKIISGTEHVSNIGNEYTNSSSIGKFDVEWDKERSNVRHISLMDQYEGEEPEDESEECEEVEIGMLEDKKANGHTEDKNMLSNSTGSNETNACNKLDSVIQALAAHDSKGRLVPPSASKGRQVEAPTETKMGKSKQKQFDPRLPMLALLLIAAVLAYWKMCAVNDQILERRVLGNDVDAFKISEQRKVQYLQTKDETRMLQVKKFMNIMVNWKEGKNKGKDRELLMPHDIIERFFRNLLIS